MYNYYDAYYVKLNDAKQLLSYVNINFMFILWKNMKNDAFLYDIWINRKRNAAFK